MFLTISLSILLLAQSPSAPGSIEGVVRRAGDGQAIEGASVTVHRLTGLPGELDQSEQSSVSGKDGKFVLSEVEPGLYTAVVEKEGYVAQVYGGKRPGKAILAEAMLGGFAHVDAMKAATTVLNVSSGQNLSGITFRMSPAAQISGRVLGAAGSPLVGARIRIIPDIYDSSGSRVVTLFDGEAQTDDRGEFRFLDAEAGRYFIVARPPSTDVEVARYAWNTFYPGVKDITSAVSISVIEGREVRVPSFSLQPAPDKHSISGRLTDNRSQRSEDHNVDLVIVARHTGGMLEVSDIITVSDPDDDGSFSASGVPSGSYWIAALSDSETEGIVGVSAVDVLGADIGGLTLTMQDPISVQGHIRIDGKAPTTEETRQIRAGLKLAEVAFFELATITTSVAETQGDGSFSIKRLFQGEFRPFVLNLPDDTYLKTARFGELPVLNQPLSLTGPTLDSLEIELSTHGGQLRGELLDQTGVPVSDTPVLLIPREDDGPQSSKTTYSDASGQFSFRGIPPGDYAILGLQTSRGSYLDATYVRRFVQDAKTVRISEDSRETSNITVIVDR